jgi:hypothetical protein
MILRGDHGVRRHGTDGHHAPRATQHSVGAKLQRDRSTGLFAQYVHNRQSDAPGLSFCGCHAPRTHVYGVPQARALVVAHAQQPATTAAADHDAASHTQAVLDAQSQSLETLEWPAVCKQAWAHAPQLRHPPTQKPGSETLCDTETQSGPHYHLRPATHRLPSPPHPSRPPQLY